MKIRAILGALTLLVSGQVGASIIDNGGFTTDTDSGLDWLDVTASVSRSYIDVSGQFGEGGDFSGWRYASSEEVVGLVYNYLEQPFPDNPNFRQNFPEGSLDVLVTMLGITYSPNYTTYGIINDLLNDSNVYVAAITLGNLATGNQKVTTRENSIYKHWGSWDTGSFLVQDISPVPVPAAIWLFGTGIIGLIGFSKRRKAA